MRTAALVVLVACGGGGGGSSGPAGTRVGPALGAALTAADHAQLPWRCVAADLPAVAEETLTASGHRWQLGGHALRSDLQEVTIGVIADAGGAAPTTIAALGRLRPKLDGVDLVIVLGGMGANQAELAATLGAIGERAPWPLVVIPGDLEPIGDHVRAIAALRQRGVLAIDGRLVQRIELPGATIATLAGSLYASRLAAGMAGCAYAVADTGTVFADLTARPGVRIVAAWDGPRRLVDGEPTGELGLVPPVASPIDIVLHGASDVASAARSGKRDGHAVALSPGPTDATTRAGRAGGPSIGVLTVRAGAWSWRPIADTP